MFKRISEALSLIMESATVWKLISALLMILLLMTISAQEVDGGLGEQMANKARCYSLGGVYGGDGALRMGWS